MTSKTINEPSIPFLIKISGNTIIPEPTMLLAIDVMTLKELSPPYYTTFVLIFSFLEIWEISTSIIVELYASIDLYINEISSKIIYSEVKSCQKKFFIFKDLVFQGGYVLLGMAIFDGNER